MNHVVRRSPDLNHYQVSAQDVSYLVQRAYPPPMVIEIERQSGDFVRVLIRVDKPRASSIWQPPGPTPASLLLARLNAAPERLEGTPWYDPLPKGGREKIISVNSWGEVCDLGEVYLPQELHKSHDEVVNATVYGENKPILKLVDWVELYNERHKGIGLPIKLCPVREQAKNNCLVPVRAPKPELERPRIG